MADKHNDSKPRRRLRWFGIVRPGDSPRTRVIYAANRFLAQQRAQQPEPPKPGAPAARAS